MNKPIRNPLYFIAILPPSSIREEIKAIKEKIRRDHNVKHALKLPAHITLKIPFRASIEEENMLLRKLKDFALEIVPFIVDLEGFATFSKNVIFIKVRNHEPFFDLHSELQEMISSFIDLKSHEISSKIHPHITIAVRDLKRSNFPEIWKDFKEKNYKNTFQADHLALLKHNGENWDLLETFEFGSI